MSTGPSEQDGGAGGRRPEQVPLLDTLSIGIVMLDSSGRVLLWGPLTEDLLGWSTDEVVGVDVRHFLAEEDAATEEERRAAFRREGRWRGILRILHKRGHAVEAEVRASLLYDTEQHPFVLVSVVETDRLRAVERDLAALDALFASSPLGIALFDTEQHFVRVNDALARLHGSSRTQHLGKTVHEVLPGRMADEVSRMQAAVLRTGRPVVDKMTEAPHGEGARSVSYARLTDRTGQVLGVSCTIMDVTERRDALRKVEAARQRLALLDDVGVALGDLLDVRAVSQALASALVPRFADYSGVLLLDNVARSGELHEYEPLTGTPLRQLGAAARYTGTAVDRMLTIGQEIPYDRGSLFGRTLATGSPHVVSSQRELLAATYPGDPKVQAALDLDIHSLLAVPLRARGIVLGLLVISRAGKREPFGHDDLALAMELADRAGTSLDNARLYGREREGALMLQRSLLPRRVPEPPGVRVASRYVPGSTGAEAGGDWFDVIPLAGGRVAFVIGDVMGHGLRAAATMGRLRTAVRTLAGLDLPPDELLRRVNDLTDDLAESPIEPVISTCVYAVYDPSTRRCLLSNAGHVPPLLRTAEGVRLLELPSGAPLGIGGVPFETYEVEVPEGAGMLLYTDGLVERRDEDIGRGLERLRDRFAAVEDPRRLEAVCDELLAGLDHAGDSSADTADDVALLLAELGGLPEGSAAAWAFEAERTAVRRAREAVRATLREWRLEPLEDTAVLLVSELVTNSLMYAHGPIGVRMVRGSSLLVEVSDPLPDPPRERNATTADEGGRGIQLVAQESRRWGTRHGPMGKTVWFEIPLS
ncbi:SpoIIE family protein phosphatase [Streptomyces sp. ODS28]|uniref:SpoIIE family protein phosphatase n=1 Tax=Streptomyces sp. ODS28 TaxID=3136688 RepID=UPI0031F0EBA6